MLISRTPYRISFFGGGTDYPAWFLKEGGAVLSTTIDKYCYITCRVLPPFFNVKYKVVWSHIEAANSVSEILHPAVRGCLRYLGFDNSNSLEIHHQGDLPARAGMGSSSAFAVGLIKALTAVRGQMIGKHELALKAIDLEQGILKDNVGCQDQVAVAHGGLNVIHFTKSGRISVEPVTISAQRVSDLESKLLLFYLGTNRLGSEIAGELLATMESKRATLLRMREMVDQATHILRGNSNLDEFGSLLHEAWMLKRSLNSRISNEQVDEVYETARANGAIGGKLLGAGGTGFVVFYVPEEKQPAVIKALNHWLHVPIQFENDGCSIIYYDPWDTVKLNGQDSSSR